MVISFIKNAYQNGQKRTKKHITCFKKNENIFSCPCCRVEYTYDLRKGELKKVLATIHLKQGQGDVVHYITHCHDTMVFIPKSQINNEQKQNKKWATILNSLKQQWEKGYTDIYALMMLEVRGDTLPPLKAVQSTAFVPNPQCHRQEGLFVLKTDDTGVAGGIHDGQSLVFRTIDVDELDEILNDC